MKKNGKTAGLAGAVMLMAAGTCALPIGLEYNNGGSSNGSRILTVVDYDLQHYVPVPVAGAVPVLGVSRPDLSIAVAWTEAEGEPAQGSARAVAGDTVWHAPAGGTFVEGAAYRANMTLTAHAAWQFSAEHFFSYVPGTVEDIQGDSGDAWSRSLTVLYRPTERPVPVGAVADLAPHIPAPVAGATAALAFIGAGYTGTAAWKAGPDFAGAPEGSLF